MNIKDSGEFLADRAAVCNVFHTHTMNTGACDAVDNDGDNVSLTLGFLLLLAMQLTLL